MNICAFCDIFEILLSTIVEMINKQSNIKFKVILNLCFYLPSPRKELTDFEGR